MTLKYSTGLRSFMLEDGSFRQALNNGRIEIYSGAQPATADAAVTGTLLCTLTAASGARTAEVLASGTLTLNTGAAGSVDTLTVNGLEIMGSSTPFNTSLTQTAADIVTKCENAATAVDYQVSSAGAVITITARPGTGTYPNTYVIAATYTTITGTAVALSGGVAAVNGLILGSASGGVINKNATQVWSGVNVASGTAGWYRWYGSIADTGALDSLGAYNREDAAIATTAAELNMASTALTISATTTVTAWQRILPTL